jgi:hypothetical protein
MENDCPRLGGGPERAENRDRFTRWVSGFDAPADCLITGLDDNRKLVKESWRMNGFFDSFIKLQKSST